MNPFVPYTAKILSKRQETPNIFTYTLKIEDPDYAQSYSFLPGQFNMLYVFGVGEVPISIASDPSQSESLEHTIRVVGNVTKLLGKMEAGETLGIRGPFGSHWPLEEAKDKDLIFITGGLGCAPVTGAIQYALKRRNQYGAIKILHGVKKRHDLIYQKKFKAWKAHPNTQVLLTSDQEDRHWKYQVGVVTNLVDEIEINPEKTVVMICGPEIMMRFAVKNLQARGIANENIYLSLERNMKCALGFCGHCQYGPHFICKQGPVVSFDKMEPFFFHKEI